MHEDYPDVKDKELIKALHSLKTEKEIENFLRDLLTLPEIKEAANRFHIATLLWHGGLSYQTIAKRAKTSTTTVTRVADWLFKKGLHGYQTALKRLHHKR